MCIFIPGLEIEPDDYMFDYKIIYSPLKNNEVTVFVYNENAQGDYPHIYIIDGKYTKKTLPKNIKYIKFPMRTGVYLKWYNERSLTIISSDEPEINTLRTNQYSVNVIVDFEKLEPFKGKLYRFLSEGNER